MEEKNTFALVQRPSSAIEKAAPGAKRILSDMVWDAIALAKKRSSPKIVFVDDEKWFCEMVEMAIRAEFKNINLKVFQDSKEAWQELCRSDPDILITGGVMGELSGQEIVCRLIERKATYPVLVVSGWQPTELWVREYVVEKPNISFLLKPFTTEQLYTQLSKHLGQLSQ